MLKFSDGTKIPKWFGDLGGNLCVNDSDFARLDFPVERFENLLRTEEFESVFRSVLDEILPYSLEIKECISGDIKIHIAPALVRYYSLAGHLSMAKVSGAKRIFSGTFRKDMAIAAAKGCELLRIPAEIALSRELSQDKNLIAAIRQRHVEVDDVTSVKYFNLPYGKKEAPFERDKELYVIPLNANYGIYPKPGLTGILAGLYGEDLLRVMEGIPQCCTVPMETGLEALGAFKALKHTDMILCTSEKTVAQEYHGCDTGTYTIFTKGENQTGETTALCPELVSMWRSGRVRRLGCDRVTPVQTAAYCRAGLSGAAARAVALAEETEGCKEILVLETEGTLWNA